jgi:hypothetical protein
MQKYKNGLKFTIKEDADFSTSMAPHHVVQQYRKCIGRLFTVDESFILGGTRWVRCKEDGGCFQLGWCREVN